MMRYAEDGQVPVEDERTLIISTDQKPPMRISISKSSSFIPSHHATSVTVSHHSYHNWTISASYRHYVVPDCHYHLNHQLQSPPMGTSYSTRLHHCHHHPIATSILPSTPRNTKPQSSLVLESSSCCFATTATT